MTSELTGGSTLKQTKTRLAKFREVFNGKQVSIIRFKPPSRDLDSIQLSKYEAARFSTEHKIKTFEALGCDVKHELLDAFIPPVEFRDLLLKLKQDSVGIIIQNPIPKTLQRLIEEIPFEKDLDGMRENNPYFATSATSETIFRLVQPFTQEGDVVAVVGAKGFVGAGIVKLLREAEIDTIELDVGDNLLRTRHANIVISTTGVPDLLDARHIIPEHRLVVDAGFVPEAGKPIRGDVSRTAYDIPQALTPVPGGVGPFQMATLMERLISRVSEQQIEPWEYPRAAIDKTQVIGPEMESKCDHLTEEQVKKWFRNFSQHEGLGDEAHRDIIEIDGKDGSSEQIAIDVTTDPTQVDSKLIQIQGQLQTSETSGDKRDKNSDRVRGELDITKHLVLVLSRDRDQLPTYKRLTKELQDFSLGDNRIGVKVLNDLPLENTIGGDYQKLAADQQNKTGPARLEAIASESIKRGDHAYYTAQVLYNDPFLKAMNDKQGKRLAVRFAMRARTKTVDHKICKALDHMLQTKGKMTENGLELDRGNLILRKDSQKLSVRSKGERGLIFDSSNLQTKINKLEVGEIKAFLKYQQGISRSKQKGQGQGFER